MLANFAQRFGWAEALGTPGKLARVHAQLNCERFSSSSSSSSSSESRRDQEEEGELDSHEEVRLSFAGPGEFKRKEVVLDPQESPEKKS